MDADGGRNCGSRWKTGSITYNGHEIDEFYVRRTSAYISQTDNHIPELTVRETLDFAARCQGAQEGFAAYTKDLGRLENEKNIRPSPEIDAFMKASSVGGKKHSVNTDYILKVLGLDICSDTIVDSVSLLDLIRSPLKRIKHNTGLILLNHINLSQFERLQKPLEILDLEVHQMALGLFGMMASIARDMVLANTFGSAALLVIFLMGGFIVPKGMVKPWWIWGYWLSPLTYGQRAITVNEFTATRWMKKSAIGNSTIGYNILNSHNIPTDDYWYWAGAGILMLYAVFFNTMVTLALAYLNPHQKARTVIPLDDGSGKNSSGDVSIQVYEMNTNSRSTRDNSNTKGMILPFQPLTMTFHNVNYYVDMPKGINGIPPIPTGYNPATWVLEVTTASVEERINSDFADIYKNSAQFRGVEASILEFEHPPAGSQPLKFDTMYSQNLLSQFFLCLWKQNLVYWRSPSYNAMRLYFTTISALIFGSNIPGWWLWFYYICPVQWTLRGIITSQLGDVETKIVGPGFEGTVKEYLAVSLGYDEKINGISSVGVSVTVLIAFIVLFFGSFAASVRFLNFQKR
ncbi:hypothetical protein TSUD_245450 [Trifolium subterraneum]|uniref:ABC-2 type transporter domain-containing protein n=1 Tax=Trifolium subterraneum TaxID=3900 RepID=A0A2Z6PGP6_TRISU|nr:hypothetical protein TSUD_245450 [Trifolium subterraneum]